MAHSTSTGHETKDASVFGIVLTGLGLAIGAAIALSIVYGIFHLLSTQELTTAPPNPMAETRSISTRETERLLTEIFW